jgi:hypothetical protein
MTEQNLITPPPELMVQWSETWHKAKFNRVSHVEFVTTQAARWGAEQELEACCEWVASHFDGMFVWSSNLRTARRSKPPSPKKEALNVLENLIEARRILDPEYQALRHALEALPND